MHTVSGRVGWGIPVGLVALIATGYLVLRPVPGGSSEGLLDPPDVSTETIAQTPAGAPLEEAPTRLAESPTPEPQRTVAEVLEEYWGEQWPEIRQRLEAAGKRLDQTFRLAPWEKVEERIHEGLQLPEGMYDSLTTDTYMQWPKELNADWLRSKFSFQGELSIQELTEIERIAEPYNADLAQWSKQYAQDLAEIIRHEIALGRFRRAPYTTASLPQRSGPSFYSHGMAADGWAAGMTLSYEDFPELGKLSDQLVGRRRERDGAILTWMAERKR